MTAAPQEAPLKITPLNQLHIELGARMVPFAGYDMPLQYSTGILKEHLHVRAAVGLFDVSHMGQFELRARSGRLEEAARSLESVVPADLIGLKPGRQRYALLTNNQGGIRDDLMVANLGERLAIVANAACKDTDEAYLRETLPERCELVRHEGRALLALQGPLAVEVLAALAPAVTGMRFMDACAMSIAGADCIVSRSGYTGEDGFEIGIPASDALNIARKLLAHPQVAMIGLGARDSLRLEAGLCLYGSDLDSITTPVEAALEWSIQPSRRIGGARCGGFPGDGLILQQLQNGAPRRRVGLRPEGRAPIRHGTRLFRTAESDEEIGVVTSGVFGPSVNAPVAMAYVATSALGGASTIYAELRGMRIAVSVTPLPFVPTKYKR